MSLLLLVCRRLEPYARPLRRERWACGNRLGDHANRLSKSLAERARTPTRDTLFWASNARVMAAQEHAGIGIGGVDRAVVVAIQRVEGLLVRGPLAEQGAGVDRVLAAA